MTGLPPPMSGRIDPPMVLYAFTFVMRGVASALKIVNEIIRLGKGVPEYQQQYVIDKCLEDEYLVTKSLNGWPCMLPGKSGRLEGISRRQAPLFPGSFLI